MDNPSGWISVGYDKHKMKTMALLASVAAFSMSWWGVSSLFW